MQSLNPSTSLQLLTPRTAMTNSGEAVILFGFAMCGETSLGQQPRQSNGGRNKEKVKASLGNRKAELEKVLTSCRLLKGTKHFQEGVLLRSAEVNGELSELI